VATNRAYKHLGILRSEGTQQQKKLF